MSLGMMEICLECFLCICVCVCINKIIRSIAKTQQSIFYINTTILFVTSASTISFGDMQYGMK